VNADRERGVTRAFVALSNSLIQDFDLVELLSGLTTDCARLLDIESAGLLLADAGGVLHVLAASSDRTRSLELFQLQRAEGPCLDCFHSGRPVLVPDLGSATDRWPQFGPRATGAGFASVHALPLRLHDRVLGALGLFSTSVGPLDDDDVSLAQALAHVACVAIVQDKVASDRDAVAAQLQAALDSRVVLEQAKGILAQLGGLDMDQAFAALRRHARDNNERLTEVARAVVRRELSGERLLPSERPER
jgi:transcriptional regulator with GAF, ATPase, and Fis domain